MANITQEKTLSAEIGQRIRHWRRLKGLTIEQLSEASELDPKYLGAIETGRRENPSYLVLRKIARGLGVDIATLLSIPEQNEKFSYISSILLMLNRIEDEKILKKITAVFSLLLDESGNNKGGLKK